MQEACSAGLEVATACSRAFASAADATVGSIGVTTALCLRGSPKRFASSAGKLRGSTGTTRLQRVNEDPTAETLGRYQAEVEEGEARFFQSLAKYRGTSVAGLRHRWADARTGTALEAINSGLLDGVRDLNAARKVLAHLPRDAEAARAVLGG
jgi:ClpP class serine protease